MSSVQGSYQIGEAQPRSVHLEGRTPLLVDQLDLGGVWAGAPSSGPGAFLPRGRVSPAARYLEVTS